MALTAVYITPEIYYICTLHALTVETEEIVGLLIGKYDGSKAYIRSILIMQRLDKRRDRVEISPEDLVMAMSRANDMSEKYDEEMNVVGWYHSHPHITGPPSHVDLGTQASYQFLDNKFVGLIVSAFNEYKNLDQEIQITCFQSSATRARIDIPLHIENTRIVFNPCLDAIFELPATLHNEEVTSFSNTENSSNSLTKIHNESAFTSSMCHILNTVVNPLFLHANNRIQTTKLMCALLEDEKLELLSKVSKTTTEHLAALKLRTK